MNIDNKPLELIKNRLWSKLSKEDIVKYKTEIIAELKLTRKCTEYMHKIIPELTMQEVNDIWNKGDKVFEPQYLFATKDGKEDIRAVLVFMHERHINTPSTFRMIDVRYYREEEIIKYPALFNIESFSTIPIVYFSRDTLTLLNKTHGRRFKYHTNMTNFKSIIGSRSVNEMPMTSDDIIYLLKKIEASNKDIVEAMSSPQVRGYVNKYAPELENFIKLCRK